MKITTIFLLISLASTQVFSKTCGNQNGETLTWNEEDRTITYANNPNQALRITRSDGSVIYRTHSGAYQIQIEPSGEERMIIHNDVYPCE